MTTPERERRKHNFPAGRRVKGHLSIEELRMIDDRQPEYPSGIVNPGLADGEEKHRLTLKEKEKRKMMLRREWDATIEPLASIGMSAREIRLARLIYLGRHGNIVSRKTIDKMLIFARKHNRIKPQTPEEQKDIDACDAEPEEVFQNRVVKWLIVRGDGRIKPLEVPKGRLEWKEAIKLRSDLSNNTILRVKDFIIQGKSLEEAMRIVEYESLVGREVLKNGNGSPHVSSDQHGEWREVKEIGPEGDIIYINTLRSRRAGR